MPNSHWRETVENNTSALSSKISSMSCTRDRDFIFKIYPVTKKSLSMCMYTFYGDSRNSYMTTENLEYAVIWVWFKCNVFGYGFVDSASSSNFRDLTGQENHPSLHLSSSAIYMKL
jgi:hypothetical protein